MTPQAKGKAMPVDQQLYLQVRELRRLGYCVNDICYRLDLHRAGERAAVEQIVDAMGRRYQPGGLLDTGPIKPGRSMARRPLT